MASHTNDEYERRMKDKAVVQHTINQHEALSRGRAGTVHPWNGLVSKMLHEAEQVLKRRVGRKSGRSLKGAVALREARLAPKVVCAVAARTMVDGVARGQRAQKTVRQIGARIEDEVRMREFQRREPALFQRLTRDLKDRGSQDYTHRRGVFMGALKRANSEERWKTWDLQTKAEVGILIADCLREAGVIEKTYKPVDGARGQAVIFELTDVYEDALRAADIAGTDFIQPWFKPMLRVPGDWSDPFDGGYETLELQLVKTRKRQELERLRQRDMPVVYGAVNAVQRTAWRINADVLVVAQELQRAGTWVEGLARHDDAVEPVRPADLPYPKKGEELELTAEQEEQLSEYKQARREYFDARAKRKSKNAQAFRSFEIAEELKDEPALYFPQQLDYRSRMYSVPLILNPQGNDLSKGLLTFGTARPLGEMGLFWLAVHGANTWGNDKGPLNDRVDWVEQNEYMILDVAEDPLSEMWWTEADSPWQFLAFCLEWARVGGMDAPPEVLSSLPVSVDGSCNGLQHFAALLRDPTLAGLTNLCRTEEQHDIYTEVRDRVEELVRQRLDMSAVDREMAGRWLDRGIDRKVVKRPVMTTPYGATLIGMKAMVLEDTINGDSYDWSGIKPWEAAAWMAERIDEALADKVGAAREAMGFLQDVSKALADERQSISWVTPAGFPVVQSIYLTSSFQIRTKLLGNVKLRFAETTDKLDRKKQRTSIAPNFVHSYDAAHLMLTVVNAEGEAGRAMSWAMVHDSFGTHAGDIDLLNQVLREQFVLMYTTGEIDPLDELAEWAEDALPVGAEIPTPPAKRGFDLYEVLDAEFFFA